LPPTETQPAHHCHWRAATHPMAVVPNETRKEDPMLYTIALVLIVLWLLGLITGYTIGSFIHILLVVAIIMILINLISGRKRLI
jgi:hypothetical protein